MKILYIIPNLRKGGAERLVLNICNELQKRQNIKVKLITFSDINEYQFLTKNIDWQVIPSKVIPSITGKPVIEINNYVKAVENFKPDIIHSNLFEAEIISRKHIFSDVAYVTHIHDNMKQFRNFSLKTIFKKERFTDFYEKKLIISKYRQCKNNFVAISKHTYNYFKQTLPKNLYNNITLIPNAIDFNRFYTAKANKKSDYESKKIKLITIGTLVKKKNQIFLIYVIKYLTEKGYNVCLDILGEGNERKTIESKINSEKLQDKIILRGKVNYVEKYLHNSYLYVHSSTSESFGLTTLEAMASGLPCISLDAKGNRDIVFNKYNGYLIAKPDYKEFADKIIRLIEDKQLYQQLSDNAVNTAKKYNIKEYADKLTNFYSKILK